MCLKNPESFVQACGQPQELSEKYDCSSRTHKRGDKSETTGPCS